MERTKRQTKHTDESIKKMEDLAKRKKLTQAGARVTKKGKRVGMTDGLIIKDKFVSEAEIEADRGRR